MLSGTNGHGKTAERLLALAANPKDAADADRLLRMAQVYATLAVAEELFSVQLNGVKSK
ncbi:hypothetical protein [Gordonia sp. C13]|uniref:hypothetical protein n=1 Tax=Gordonia sp. C13 TaxID=2935078 RepID=UPI00200B3CD0|nr:hypothetical protein [Gordonia sp. C13]MCK8615859.1 hypothetical protein [Gordonia sp. C13]